MPPVGDFVGSNFRLESVTPIGLATLRVKYAQDPKAFDPTAQNDALNIDNYTLTGSELNYVIAATTVFSDPQSIDLYLAAPLDLGEWTLAAANVVAENLDALQAPTSLTFTVSFGATQSPVSGGALNDGVVNVLRKFLSPALKGKGWDSFLAALAAGDSPNWDNAKKAFNQLYTSTASGAYLDRRAADNGYTRPADIAMPDDLFRQLVTVSGASKLTQEALLEVLEVYYGPDSVRASSTTSLSSPFILEDGDDLQLLIDERETVNVVFARGEFARIGQATAVEVAAAITRSFRTARSQAYAIVHVDETTGQQKVRIYSGRLGLASAVRVLGGKAQTRLVFPTSLFDSVPSVPPIATWTITHSPEPGRKRFTMNDVGTFDLNVVKLGDRALIYGQEFAFSGNQGTFEILEVSVSYTGSTLVAYFEVDNPDATDATVIQLDPQSLMFFRATKRTTYDAPHRVLVSQTGPAVDIAIAATTRAVARTAKTGSYGVLNDQEEVDSLVREAGVVHVTTIDPHGLAVGNVIIVDGASASLSLPALSATGTPSGDFA